MSPLVRLTGDGTLTGTDTLDAQQRIRRLLGSPRVPEVAPAAYLPWLGQRGRAATPLAATISALDGLDADLAPYGWRLGTGRGGDLVRAKALRAEDLDLLPASLLDAEAPSVLLPFLGPATLWSRAFLPAGERVVSDAGARHDVAAALAAGAVDQVQRARHLAPGLRVGLLVREDDAAAVAAGRLRTASALHRHPPLAVEEIGEAWQRLADALRDADVPLLLAADGGPDLLDAAERARPDGLAVDPTRETLGRGRGTAWWERVAALHEAGTRLHLRTDPDAPDRTPDRFLAAWTGLGFPASAARGTGLMAFRPDRIAPEGTRPGGARPGPLSTADLDAVFETARRFADGIGN